MISTHVLDTQNGLPAAGITVELERKSGNNWVNQVLGETNADGRISFNVTPEAGIYRLNFQTESYFQKNGVPHFFPIIPVVFMIQDTARKYHVPLLLNPFGYSTYRGS